MIIRKITIIFIILSLSIGCSYKKDIEVIRFNEDTTGSSKISGFKISSHHLKDDMKQDVRNLWITKSFLDDSNNLKKIKYYADNGYSVWIQGENPYILYLRSMILIGL